MRGEGYVERMVWTQKKKSDKLKYHRVIQDKPESDADRLFRKFLLCSALSTALTK